jgi:hypothetical protein
MTGFRCRRCSRTRGRRDSRSCTGASPSAATPTSAEPTAASSAGSSPTGRVCDLEARGYVERVPDPADGRAKIIRLTEQGAEAKATALEIFAEIEAEWAERIGPERVQALRDALEVLYELERSAPIAA